LLDSRRVGRAPRRLRCAPLLIATVWRYLTVRLSSQRARERGRG
jgi:hypothetical protein